MRRSALFFRPNFAVLFAILTSCLAAWVSDAAGENPPIEVRFTAAEAKEMWKGAFVVREGRSVLLEPGTRGERLTAAPSSYADIALAR